MKNKVLVLTAFVLLVTTFFSCSPKEEEEEDPVDFSIDGPSEVFQTQTTEYHVIPAMDQPGTKWVWFVEGAKKENVSNETKTVTVSFPTVPANDTVSISATAITSGGAVSQAKVVKVYVESFCILDLNNFIGAFSCDEAGYGIYPVNFSLHPTLANTIVNDNFWDWPALGEVVYYTFSGDFLEEITVPRQDFIFGDDFAGWVEGSGTYDGCAHTMIVDYTVFWGGDEFAIHHEFSASTKGIMYPVLVKKTRENIKK